MGLLNRHKYPIEPMGFVRIPTGSTIRNYRNLLYKALNLDFLVASFGKKN